MWKQLWKHSKNSTEPIHLPLQEHLSHLSHGAGDQQHSVRLPEEITDGLQSENGVIVKVHQHVLLSFRSCTDKRAVMKTSKGVRPLPETLRLTPSFLLTALPLV